MRQLKNIEKFSKWHVGKCTIHYCHTSSVSDWCITGSVFFLKKKWQLINIVQINIIDWPFFKNEYDPILTVTVILICVQRTLTKNFFKSWKRRGSHIICWSSQSVISSRVILDQDDELLKCSFTIDFCSSPWKKVWSIHWFFSRIRRQRLRINQKLFVLSGIFKFDSLMSFLSDDAIVPDLSDSTKNSDDNYSWIHKEIIQVDKYFIREVNEDEYQKAMMS